MRLRLEQSAAQAQASRAPPAGAPAAGGAVPARRCSVFFDPAKTPSSSISATPAEPEWPPCTDMCIRASACFSVCAKAVFGYSPPFPDPPGAPSDWWMDQRAGQLISKCAEGCEGAQRCRSMYSAQPDSSGNTCADYSVDTFGDWEIWRGELPWQAACSSQGICESVCSTCRWKFSCPPPLVEVTSGCSNGLGVCCAPGPSPGPG